MFGFLKNLFSSNKERKVFNVEEEYKKLLNCLEKHNIFYSYEKDKSGELFDYKSFYEYVEKSEYVSDYIREKTLERLEVLKPVFFYRDEISGYLFMTIDFFLKYEHKAISNLIEHIETIRENNKIIEENTKELNKRVEEAMATIEEAKLKIAEFIETNEHLKISNEYTKLKI